MWTRESIKMRARQVLKFNYWQAFFVSLIIALAGGSSDKSGEINWSNRNEGYRHYGDSLIGDAIVIFQRVALFIASIAIILFVLRIIIGYVLEVGGRKFFIKAAEGKSDMGYLGYCFKERRYIDVLLTMLLRDVYTLLWTLLLIIPGIIKSYSYRMVPYILADNPSIGYNRAIELSEGMTEGEKWNIFVLDLSFIGWYLLGTLAFLVGTLFVHPYDNATNAELYLILREDAIRRGMTSHEELKLDIQSFEL